jgi:hypothetical protein
MGGHIDGDRGRASPKSELEGGSDLLRVERS